MESQYRNTEQVPADEWNQIFGSFKIMAFTSIKIEVNKKVNGKYSPVGAVDIFVPTLEDAKFAGMERMKDEKGAEVFEDGLPVYKEDAHNWIQGAILAQVKAQARNKLVSGTATLKDGQAIAVDWPTLTVEGERGGNGEALAIVREAKADFGKWVASLGKSQAAQATLNTLFSNKQALSLQSPEHKAKMATYVTDFAGTLEAEKLAKFEKYLNSVVEAAQASVDADDF